MAPVQSTIAQYVLALDACLNATHRAEDRETYRSYLADVAAILASVVAGGNTKELERRVAAHDRLRGHTWLISECAAAADAWSNVLKAVRNAA
jgi:hypothetical protein